MEDLFTGCSADGSLAMDQNTCMDVSDDSDSGDSMGLHDLNSYPPPEDPLGDDSDTMPTPSRRSNGDNSCSSNSAARSGMKRSRGSTTTALLAKKASKAKNRLAESNEEITATIKSLRETVVASAPPQMPQIQDPHATLWQKLENIPLTPDQRILIGEHLSSKEHEGKRGWLSHASDDTFHAWVFKFLCDKEGY